MWGVSLTHPCWLLFFLIWGVTITHPVMLSFFFSLPFSFLFFFFFHFFLSFFIWGVSLTHPLLASFLSGEFLLHIPCWLHFYLGSFSYTTRASFHWISGHISFIFMWEVSFTHPLLTSFLCIKFLLHIPCCLHFSAWSFSYTYHARFSFILGFLLHIPCWLHFHLGSFTYTSHAGFIFYLGSFCYTSRAGFIFIWGVSHKHPMLDLHFCGVFHLHIPCWLLFLIWGVSLTH